MQVIKTKTAYKMNLSHGKHSAWGLFAIVVIIMMFINNPVKAQSISASSIQELSFGSFVTGSTGGTIEVSPLSNRSVSGTIFGLAVSPVSAAVFEVIVKGNNKNVQILFQESAQLTRVGGTEFMTVSNFISDKPGNNFNTTKEDDTFQINVGATLNVQNSTVNPPGDYRGTFTVTFIRQ